jgi:hypothetical protein
VLAAVKGSQACSRCRPHAGKSKSKKKKATFINEIFDAVPVEGSPGLQTGCKSKRHASQD